MQMQKRVWLSAAFAAASMSTGSALAGPSNLTVLFSNIAASSTSDVPGIPGLKFKPGTGTATAFDRLFVSPDGNRWVFGGFVDAATTADDVIVTGFGTTAAGASVVVRAGDPTSFNPGVNYNVINTHMSINNAGQIAFSGNTSAASSQFIGFFDGTSVQQVAQQGGASPIGGANWTATLNGANVTGDGRVGYQGSTTPTPTQYLTVLDGNVLSQNAVTVPTGQLAAPDQPNNVLTSNSFRVSDDGTQFMYRTTLSGPTATNTIVALNNNVLAQLGAPVPGWSNVANVSSIASEAGSVQLSRNGAHWAFRGAVNDGVGAVNQTDFVLVDGNVVAATDQAIHAGATERFDDALFGQTFFMNITNNVGDYVVGGVTDNADLSRNAVLVFNDSFVVAREFDPVDLDGNGLFDDDVFISVFGNDDAALTDNLDLFFTASLMNSQGTLVGNALIVIKIPSPGAASLLGLAGLAFARRRRA